MATIKASIALRDGMSGTLKRVRSALDNVIDCFEDLHGTSGRSIDTAKLRAARAELAGMDEDLERVERGFREASSSADGFTGKLKAAAAAAAAVVAAGKVLSFGMDSLKFSDTQRNAEMQLAATMKNAGMTEDAFKSIKQTAAELQKKGIYGDEVMLGGAAEFATYMSDPRAIESMMGTLSNYAMGMTGGGEIDYSSMVDYATQLGKALNGSFDGLSKKGFEVTEAQKAIIEHGTDMEKALVLDEIIAESWDGLYATMSSTPEGKIIQLKNKIGDLREGVGDKLYGAVLKAVDLIESRFGGIEAVFDGIGNAASLIVEILTAIGSVALSVAGFISDNWSIIEPIFFALAAAALVYAMALGVQAAASWIANTAAGALFKTLLANPLMWIAVGIGAVVAVIYRWIKSVGGLTNAWEIAKLALKAAWHAIEIGWHSTVYGIVWGVNKVCDFIDLLKLAWQKGKTSVANHVGDMKVSVLTILQNMINSAIDILNGFIGLLNKIPGVNIEAVEHLTFAADAAARNDAEKQARAAELRTYEDKLDAAKQERERKLQVVQDNIDRAKNDMHAASDEFKRRLAEAKAQANAAEDQPAPNAWELSGGGGRELAENTGETAANTAAMRDALDYMEEDLAYMLDIAEREAINRYTTAEITVEQNNTNYIDGDTDVDGIMDAFAADFAEKLDISGEGVDL